MINTEQNIQPLKKNETILCIAKKEWEEQITTCPCFSLSSSKKI